MNCACGQDTAVMDSRVNDNGALRRRRACKVCGARFTTYEVREDSVARSINVQLDFGMLNGVIIASSSKSYLCPCGNEARYRKYGDPAPSFCGICDILKNEGRGERV